MLITYPGVPSIQKNNKGSSSRERGRRQRSRRKSKSDSVGKYFGDAWSLAKRTAIGLNEIRKLINIETKLFEEVTSGSVNNTGFVQNICVIPQGTDYNNRIGDSIKLQRIRSCIRFSINASDTTSVGTYLRLMIVRDLDQNGTAPTISEMLTATSELATYNHLREGRFSYLYDEVFNLSNVAGDSNGYTIFDTSHEGHIKFIASATSSASAGKGTVYFVAISNQSSNTPDIIARHSIYYTDD